MLKVCKTTTDYLQYDIVKIRLCSNTAVVLKIIVYLKKYSSSLFNKLPLDDESLFVSKFSLKFSSLFIVCN